MILRAAAKVFAQSGFEAASMADIAATAGVKKALVQYHFETKENLWRSAIAHLWAQRDEVLPALLDKLPSADGKAALREIFLAIARFNRRHPEWIATLLRESSVPGPRRDWLVENFLRNDMERGTGFIEQAQLAGVLPTAAPLQLLHLISGALFYNTLVAPITADATGIDMASDDALLQQVDLLLQLLQ